MRPFQALLTALLLAGALAGAAPPARGAAGAGLAVEGETALLVLKTPFKVTAPAGGKLYFWSLPAGWKGDAKRVSASNEVTVGEAAPGTAVVAVVVVGKELDAREYELTVHVGKVSPPPVPPVPPVPPGPDPLVATLKAAYARETDPQRARHLANFATVCRTVATEAAPRAATWGKLLEAMRAGAASLGSAGKLVEVQKALNAHLAAALPVNPSERPGEPLTPEQRVLVAREFVRAADCLEAAGRD